MQIKMLKIDVDGVMLNTLVTRKVFHEYAIELFAMGFYRMRTRRSRCGIIWDKIHGEKYFCMTTERKLAYNGASRAILLNWFPVDLTKISH